MGKYGDLKYDEKWYSDGGSTNTFAEGTKDNSLLWGGMEALSRVAGAQYLKNQLRSPEYVAPTAFVPSATRNEYDIQGVLNQANQANATNAYNLRQKGGTFKDYVNSLMQLNNQTQGMVGNAFDKKQIFDAQEQSRLDTISNTLNQDYAKRKDLANLKYEADLSAFNREKLGYDQSAIESAANFLQDAGDRNYAKVLEEIRSKTAAISKVEQ
jgi:hypothetical protein